MHTPHDFRMVILCNRDACDIELGTFLINPYSHIFKLASVYADTGHYFEAVNDLKAVLVNTDGIPSPTLSRAYFRLARCYFELSSYDEAKAEMDNYDRSMDSTTITVSQPAVTKLKREINDKRNEMKNKGKKPQKSLSLSSEQPPRRITYEAKVVGSDSNPFFRQEIASASLCVHPPHERRMREFLVSIVKKYYEDIFYSRPYWFCWRCGDQAKCMIHLPAAYLHLPAPFTVDLIRPVCGNNRVCERRMRRMRRMFDDLPLESIIQSF